MKLVLLCWSCGKQHDDVDATKTTKCKCGGYVVTPERKVWMRYIDEKSGASRLRELEEFFKEWD